MKTIKNFELFCEGGTYSPKQKIEYPMLYGIMTKELSDKLKEKGKKAIGIMNDGYIISCETPDKFEKCKKDYIKGNKYKGEEIICVAFGPEKQYGN